MTIISSRFVRRVGALNMFRAGKLWITVCDGGVWMVFSALMGIGFWALVRGRRCGVCRLCVDGFVQCDGGHFWMSFHIWPGTASSLAGTFRFGIGAIVGALLSLATFTGRRPMIWSVRFCAALFHSVLYTTPAITKK